MCLNKEKNFVSAVVYICNHEHEITSFLKMLNACFKENFEKYEIICVDDGSSDNSIAAIRAHAAEYAEDMVSIVHMSYYQGLELAMNAGVDMSIGDFVFEFDSPVIDFPQIMIKDIYFHALTGYDIVTAAPKEQDHQAAALFYSIFNWASRTQSILRTECFRILSRRAINRVHSMSAVIPYRKAVYANCGLNTDVLFFDGKKTKLPLNKQMKYSQQETAINAFVLYSDLAWRCSVFVSMLMLGLVLGCGLYTIIIYCSGKPVAGWTTTMLFLSVCFTGIFILLTVLIKYVSLILKLNFSRQNYVIESIEKLK